MSVSFAQQTPVILKILEQLKELEQNNDNFYDSAFTINAQIMRAENELLALTVIMRPLLLIGSWQSILGIYIFLLS